MGHADSEERSGSGNPVEALPVKAEESPFFHLSNKRNDFLELNDYIPNFRQAKNRSEQEFKQKIHETEKVLKHLSQRQK